MSITRISRISRIAAAAALLVGTTSCPAGAAFINFDLTGTWTGSLKCSAFIGGVKTKTTSTPVLKISQVGRTLGLLLDFGGSTNLYTGLANPDFKKPEQKGEVAVIFCGTNAELGDATSDEIGRMSVSAKPQKVKASFKGLSFFSDPTDPLPDAGSCKWKWTRTSDADPNVDLACGIPGLVAQSSARRHARGGR